MITLNYWVDTPTGMDLARIQHFDQEDISSMTIGARGYMTYVSVIYWNFIFFLK